MSYRNAHENWYPDTYLTQSDDKWVVRWDAMYFTHRVPLDHDAARQALESEVPNADLTHFLLLGNETVGRVTCYTKREAIRVEKILRKHLLGNEDLPTRTAALKLTERLKIPRPSPKPRRMPEIHKVTVLGALSDRPLASKALAYRIGLGTSYVRKFLKELKEDGFIDGYRTHTPDGGFFITAQGREKLVELRGK